MKKILYSLLILILCAFSFTAFSQENVLRLPENLNSVEAGAFYGDKAISEVIVPVGVRSIGERAFAYTGLTRITIPASVSHIADNAFEGVSAFTVYVEEES
ncbi:MAG: leucine-rich repeat protein, partial [Clostridia bacterium]|nr:leucine-rich repeat protein [Clostridia bacterium]